MDARKPTLSINELKPLSWYSGIIGQQSNGLLGIEPNLRVVQSVCVGPTSAT